LVLKGAPKKEGKKRRGEKKPSKKIKTSEKTEKKKKDVRPWPNLRSS
jgi:hypothetical protein